MDKTTVIIIIAIIISLVAVIFIALNPSEKTIGEKWTEQIIEETREKANEELERTEDKLKEEEEKLNETLKDFEAKYNN